MINMGFLATHGEEIMYLSILFLKLWIFKTIHILPYLVHLTFMPDTKFINGTSHTHMHTETHTDRYRYHFYILHFLAHLACMPKIQILYLAYHRLTLSLL